MHPQKSVSCALEHVNITVSNIQESTRMLCEIFGWKLRWEGPTSSGGRTAHVGTDSQYLAVYTPPRQRGGSSTRYSDPGSLNHLAIVVEDLEQIEARVQAFGLTPFNHGDYKPGRRFYFVDHDGIEFEVVSYAEASSKPLL